MSFHSTITNYLIMIKSHYCQQNQQRKGEQGTLGMLLLKGSPLRLEVEGHVSLASSSGNGGFGSVQFVNLGGETGFQADYVNLECNK